MGRRSKVAGLYRRRARPHIGWLKLPKTAIDALFRDDFGDRDPERHRR